MQIHLPYMCSASNQIKLSTCVKMGCYYFSLNYLFIFNPDISSYSTTHECVLLAIQIMPNPLEIDSKQRTVLAKRACLLKKFDLVDLEYDIYIFIFMLYQIVLA